MEELEKLWEKVMIKVQNVVSFVTYDVWMSKLEPLCIKDNTLLLYSSSISVQQQVLRHHNNQLEMCIKEVFGDDFKFEILNPEEKEKYVETEKIVGFNQAKLKNENKSQFNEKYTFNNFVVGSSNKFCYAAAHSVAENPGSRFNPLFIYSGVGLGKTHLMHAIGNYIAEHSPKLKIKYVTCEKFMNDYIESLRTSENGKDNAIFEFRDLYRNVDVLMIDDIQFIEDKKSTKEEFFHTFNDLYQNNKQIIITSDRHPQEIDIEDRLKSRFSNGLIQDMQIPDYETRMAIIKNKAQLEKYYLDDEVMQFIAEKPFTNIREMEGMLSKVFFFATLMGKRVATIDDAMEAFKEQHFEKESHITPDTIIDCVCQYFGITHDEIIGKKKTKEIVEPRMFAIYLIDDLLDLTLVSIGKIFGGRDYTTIIHAREKIYDQIKKDNKVKAIVNELKNKIINN